MGIYICMYMSMWTANQIQQASAIREENFRRELPLALEAIRYGDRYLFKPHPYLDNASIWVCFGTGNQENCQLEHWGYLKEFIDDSLAL